MVHHLLGLLRVRVLRGVDLAIRDVRSSDPYVILRMGKQKLKTRVIKRNVNPEWNEDLTLSVEDPSFPVRLVINCRRMTITVGGMLTPVQNLNLGPGSFTQKNKIKEVYDKDMFSADDPMGYAEFDIQPFVEAVKMNLGGIQNDTIITKVMPSRQNCLAEESPICWSEGKVVQDMALRLKQVETGEVELRLEWVSIPGSKGL